VQWDDAMDVLAGWAGRTVVVVAFLTPGISLQPVVAPLALDRTQRGVVRLDVPGLPVALRRATFIEAGWVPGREGEGLSVVQGGARVDVFLDGAA